MQFAGGFAQTSEEQNHGRGRPRNFLASVRQGLFQEFVQCQSAQQLFSQPRATEFPAALHPHPLHIDFHPFWFGRAKQIRLMTRAFLRAVLHAQTALLVHHSQPRYDALPGTSIRTIALHQRPIGVPFAIFATKATPQIHAAMLRFQETKSRGLVVTTCTFRWQTTPLHNTQPQTKELAALPCMRLCSKNFRLKQNCGRSARTYAILTAPAAGWFSNVRQFGNRKSSENHCINTDLLWALVDDLRTLPLGTFSEGRDWIRTSTQE